MSFVFFRRSDVVMAGDILDMRHFPVIDVAKGGSINGEIAALNRLVDLAIPSVPIVSREAGTIVIPGHGRMCDQFDVVEYRDMVTIIRDRVRDLIKRREDAGPDQGGVAGTRIHAPLRLGFRARGRQTNSSRRSIKALRRRSRERRSRHSPCLTAVWLCGSRCSRSEERLRRRRRRERRRPIDLTGYWVAFVNEDWRYRMVTPAKGDYRGVPITPEALQIVNAWDPAADEAAGNQCKSYGAGAIMRVPGRIHITWQDDNTLRLDTDAGTQTRLFRFRRPPLLLGRRAHMAGPIRRAMGTAAAAALLAPRRGGSLTVVTTNMRAGYLRKNGVPYSENATVTEYFDVAPQPTAVRLLRRHDRRRRPAILTAAVHRELAFQERSGRFQMGSDTVLVDVVAAAPRAGSLTVGLVFVVLSVSTPRQAFAQAELVGSWAATKHRRHLARLVPGGLHRDSAERRRPHARA